MWDKGRRSEAQRKRRIAAKSQCADSLQQGGGGWRILTAIVTTVRSAKAVITTFCRMLSCENRGHSRIRTKMHLNCVKLEGNSASHQTGTALAAHVPVPHSKVSAVFPGDGQVVVGERGGLWDGDALLCGDGLKEGAMCRLPSGDYTLHSSSFIVFLHHHYRLHHHIGALRPTLLQPSYVKNVIHLIPSYSPH